MIGFDLKVNNSDTAQKILTEICKVLNRGLRKAETSILTVVRNEIRSIIYASKEVDSFINDELQGHLGVVEPAQAIEEITKAIQAAVRSKVEPCKPVGNEISGGMSVYLYNQELLDTVMGLGIGTFISNEFVVPWLKWWLTAGSEIVVFDYHFVSLSKHPNRKGSPKFVSRTGKGIMGKGGEWSVPQEFAGTPENNWIIRSITQLLPKLEEVFEKELGKAL